MDFQKEWNEAQRELAELAGPAGRYVDQVMPGRPSPEPTVWEP